MTECKQRDNQMGEGVQGVDSATKLCRGESDKQYYLLKDEDQDKEKSKRDNR